MKQFRSFVKKEFCHIFRDKRTMLILLVMPVVQLVIFGFAINTEVKNARMAVFDPSNDEVTRRIVELFEANAYFTVAEELTSPGRITDVFKSGRIDLVLVFPENFAADLVQTGRAPVQLLADGAEPNQASLQVAYAQNILAGYARENVQPGKPSFRIVPELKMLYNPQQKSAYNFVPGVMGMILLLICAMMSSVAIVREKETGTMEVLLASPLEPVYIILAKLVPYFVISAVDLALILLLAVFVLHVPVAGSLFWLVAVALLYILAALSLGLLISTLVNSQLAAMLGSGMVLMIPTVLLSGIVFPIESMPEVLQYLSAIVPARWFVEAVRKLMIQGADVQYVLRDFLVIGGMTGVFLAVAWKKFKIRLE